MNDNHPVRSGSAKVGGDDDLAHSFFLQEAFDPAPSKMFFFKPPILWIFGGTK